MSKTGSHPSEIESEEEVEDEEDDEEDDNDDEYSLADNSTVHDVGAVTAKEEDVVQAVMKAEPELSVSELKVLKELEKLQEKTERYVKSILDPSDHTVDRMYCPAINVTRYSYLRPESITRASGSPRTYYIAINLRQVVDLLPRLLGSVVEAARFLGPGSVALSIVEGNSDDGTAEVLAALAPGLAREGVRYFLREGEKIDPKKSDRIGSLARLRSLALEPLRNSRNDTARRRGLPGGDMEIADDAVVVFLNDVAACSEDIRGSLAHFHFLFSALSCGHSQLSQL